MQFLVVAIVSCTLWWTGSLCDSGTKKTKRDVIEISNGPVLYQESKTVELYQPAPNQGLAYTGKITASSSNSGSTGDASKQTVAANAQEIQGASHGSTPGSNFPTNQQLSNNPLQTFGTQPAAFAQALTAAPQLSFSTGFSSTPYNFNYFSSPLASSNNELFAETQNPFIVNQPLVQSFSGQHDLTTLAQTAPAAYTGLYSANQPLFNAALDTSVTKYLQPEINLTPQSDSPAPQFQLPAQQFKTTPLINSHIYHPRVSSFHTPRQNIYPSQLNLNQKQQDPQSNQQDTLSKQHNTVPQQRHLTYKQPRLLHNQQNRQPVQKTALGNQYNVAPEQQNVLPEQPKQQSIPPQRYYIRRKPQRILDNQQNAEQQQQNIPQQENIYNNKPNAQLNRLNRLQNLQNAYNNLQNQHNIYNALQNQHNNYNTLPKQQNTFNLQPNVQSNQQNVLGQQRNVPVPLLSPPTPPRLYSNFKPMIPKTIPVTEPVVQEELNQEEDTKEENKNYQKEEENKNEEKSQQEEDESSNENQEENADSEEQEEEPVKPKFSGKYRDQDSEDDDDRESYRREEDGDDEEYEENRDSSRYSESPVEYSKLFSKHRYPKEYNFVPSYLKQHRAHVDCDRKDAFKFKDDYTNPDVKVKMFKYTKSFNQPDINESIEGKESETVPVVHHRKKSYKEHWVITKSSKSMK